MSTKFNRGVILSLATFFSVLVAGVNTSMGFAATSTTNGVANGFTVSPVISNVTVEKGQSDVVPITVTNPTTTSLVAVPVVNDFVASSDETGTPKLILKSGVSLPPNNFQSLIQPISPVTLGPGQTQTINVTIAVPKTAFSGGYYGAIRFVPGSLGNVANVGLTASVGSLFLVTVPGNLTTKLTLTQLSAADVHGNTSSFFTNGQISAVIRLTNSGNIHTAPFGTVEIKNMFGHIISTTQFNNSTPPSYILPQSTRKFVVQLPHHNYIGHYTLTASIGYGTGGGNLIIASAGFWYVPIWLQIVILAVIVLIVALIYWIVRSINSRKFGKRRK